MAPTNDRLARAKAYLKIAESKDSKRDAYKKAAKEIAAHRQATGENWTEIAVKLGRVALGAERKEREAGRNYVTRLVNWYENGAVDLPFARVEGETKRKTLHETKKALAEAPIEEVEKIVLSLPAERVAKIAQATYAKPGLAHEMAKDPEASAAVTRLSGRVTEEMVAQNKQRRRKTSTTFSGTIETLSFLSEVLGALMKAKRCLSEAYTAAREHDLDSDQREALIEQLDELQTVSNWFRSFVESGDQSFEDELEKLLAD